MSGSSLSPADLGCATEVVFQERNESGGESPDETIHLWHGSLEHGGWRQLAYLLSDSERRRADAFFFERDARRFVISHAVLRILLGQATGIPARELKFRDRPGLKPVIEGPRRAPHFSLSRSEEMVLIGFAARPLGVDIEWLGRTLNVEDLEKDVLSPREQKAFNKLRSADRREAFFRCWTLKEAYLKAIGTGLDVPPASVEVCFKPGRMPELKRILGDERAAAGWFADVIMPCDDYVAAVAIPGTRWRVTMTGFETSSLLLGA